MRVPILRVKEILLISIQVELTDEDAIQFQADVVEKVAETDARGVVIDITALDIVDSFMARVINDTANMAKLLGAEVVVCGIQPAVAITLIEMGRGLIGVDTTFNLEQGIDRLNALIASRGDHDAYLSSDLDEFE